MSDTDVDALDVRSCADALDAWVADARRLDARRLALVAHWADLHAPTAEQVAVADAARGRARLAPAGSDGTPLVLEHSATELGMLLGTTTQVARSLLRDTLDLRHRHPLLWAEVQRGRVEDWVARKVARAAATADLTRDQARQVDRDTVAALTGLPVGRALAVVDAAIMAVDADEARRRAELEAGRTFVSTGRPSDARGLRTLIARTTAGDVARLQAMIGHLADLMAASGDPTPADGRRAKALGLLANPALTCLFLARAHPTTTDATDTDGPEPTDPPEPPDPQELGALSAVELAAAFGDVLHRLGPAAWDRLRPRSVVYAHLGVDALAQGDGHPGQVARVEGVGPVTLGELRSWLANDRITVQPVLDPSEVAPVDAYEVPHRLREALALREPFEVFPWGTQSTRTADADHTDPYVPAARGGPPGQTGLHNLGPLSRSHHRAKTHPTRHGAFSCYQPLPGLYLWQAPSGHWFQVDGNGTRRLGRETPAILCQLRQRLSVVEQTLRVLVSEDLTAA